jgi:exodeoxyribonuclease V gamma subunit
VYTASQLAPLLNHLGALLTSNPLPPRDDELIVVQSQGMRRWVTLQLADQFGCAASLAMPFPAAFVRDIERRVAPDRSSRADVDLFTRELMTWRVDTLLQQLPLNETAYQPLRAYLRVNDARARFGLATQIAARFDDYQLFRADTLSSWERGEQPSADTHAGWQSLLWRALCAESSAPHLADRLRRTISAVQSGNGSALPSRVTVFGVSALPPVVIELLAALSEHVPVAVYTASLPEQARHPIGEVLGLQSREFLALLADHGASIHTLHTRADIADTLLARLQRELCAGDAGDSPLVLDAADASLRVHSAHGQRRQLEVLRDQLLDAMQRDTTLRPHDLLLLVPDATEWAPLVDAVLGGAGVDGTRIPYRIADRPARRAQPAAEAFSRLLALDGGRLARSEVFNVLNLAIVRQAAELTQNDVELLEALTQQANIRWGYDAADRVALDLPEYEDASWRAGLDRLLVGVAAGEYHEQVLGVLPTAGDTAGDPETLAQLADWIDALAAHVNSWRTARSLGEWSAAFSAAVESLLMPDSVPEKQSVESLNRTISRLREIAELTAYDALVPFSLVRDWLENQFDDDGLGSGFLTGGMTVAALKPMRSLPFRVIAVAGLDDGVFPRRDRRSAFDLLEVERRPGDRDLRSDDRQLFLDVLLAAQSQLILSYSGRAVRDNAPCAPSVVIDELLDHLDRRTAGQARATLVVQHPLQPFSPAYFGGDAHSPLFTFSKQHAAAAQVSNSTDRSEPAFVESALDPAMFTDADIHQLSLRDLTDCWQNPSQFYCTRSLRLWLQQDAGDAQDDEPFTLDALNAGSVRSRILAQSLVSAECVRDNERLRERLEASGELPLDALGAAWYAKLRADVDNVLVAVPKVTPEFARLELALDEWQLTGGFDQIRGAERIVVRAGSVRPEHYIRAWIEHLAMCAAQERGASHLPRTTRVIGKKKADCMTLDPVSNASRILLELLRATRSARSAPLPFFANAGWEYLQAKLPPKRASKSAVRKDPRAAAIKGYESNRSAFAVVGNDEDNPYVQLCFRGSSPVRDRWDEFESLANLLFGEWPLLVNNT